MAPFGPLYFLEKHPRQPAPSASQETRGSAPQRAIGEAVGRTMTIDRDVSRAECRRYCYSIRTYDQPPETAVAGLVGRVGWAGCKVELTGRTGCSSTEVKRSAASHDGEEFPAGLFPPTSSWGELPQGSHRT